MPVAQQPSQQHHHHLFTAIGSFLHALQPSSHHSSSGTSPSLSRHGSSDLSDLYQAFESQLAQRLSSLLPAEDAPSVSLGSLKQLMGFLLATQTDLKTLVPRNHKHAKSMEEFLERSSKLLDVCRIIKEQMLEMESLQGMLHLVIFCLNSDNGELNQGQVSRARKALVQLAIHMEVEREDQADHGHTRRSFRERLRERLCRNAGRELSQQRWHSWQRSHGCSQSSSSSGQGNQASAPGSSASATMTHVNQTATPVHAAGLGGNPGSQALHTLELNLLPPRIPPKDEEEYFSAALYGLNVLSIFSLGTISAAFPSFGKVRVTFSIQPSHIALWAAPFLRLQEKVDEELRERTMKHGGFAGMWELDQISSLAKRLFELVSPDEFLELDDNKREVEEVIKIFSQHVEELEKDTGSLHSQIDEYYDKVIEGRTRVLDMLCDADG